MALLLGVAGFVGLVVSAAQLHNIGPHGGNVYMAAIIACGLALFLSGRFSVPRGQRYYDSTTYDS